MRRSNFIRLLHRRNRAPCVFARRVLFWDVIPGWRKAAASRSTTVFSSSVVASATCGRGSNGAIESDITHRLSGKRVPSGLVPKTAGAPARGADGNKTCLLGGRRIIPVLGRREARIQRAERVENRLQTIQTPVIAVRVVHGALVITIDPGHPANQACRGVTRQNRIRKARACAIKSVWAGVA